MTGFRWLPGVGALLIAASTLPPTALAQDAPEADALGVGSHAARPGPQPLPRAEHDPERVEPPPTPHEKWFVETGAGWQPSPDDAYLDTLQTFGFEESSGIFPRLFVRVTGGLMLNRTVGFTLSYQRLESRAFNREFDGPSGPSNRDAFVWTAHRVAVGLRLARPLVDRWLVLYGDATVGVTLAPTEFEDETGDVDSQLEFGPGFDAVVGLQSHFTKRFGLFVEGGYGWTPVPENLLGDRHNAAGGRIVAGLRLRGEGNWR